MGVEGGFLGGARPREKPPEAHPLRGASGLRPGLRAPSRLSPGLHPPIPIAEREGVPACGASVPFPANLPLPHHVPRYLNETEIKVVLL